MDLFAVALAFPERGPYRVDQVRSDPAGLILLFALELALAWLIDGSSRRGLVLAERVGSGFLVLTVSLIFMLGSWGLGDVTRLSYLLVENPTTNFGWREPFWTMLAPVIRFLPYRFSFVHGAVAGCYVAATLWLAHRMRSPAWGGWWALMVVHSPLLRNFLQSGVTRQALVALLLLPLMLWCAGGPRLSPMRTMALTTFAALCHSSYLLSLGVAISPLVVAGRYWLQQLPFGLGLVRSSLSRHVLWIAAASVMAVGSWMLVNAEGLLARLNLYLWDVDYYPLFLLRPEADQLLASLVIAILAVCYFKRIGLSSALKSAPFRSMGLFFVFLVIFRFSIQYAWLPQLTSRLQDAVGLYLVMLFIVWVCSLGLQRATVLPIAVTLQYWFFDRLAFAGLLDCGRNDEFLCVPDRLPWDVIYWN
ncbi:MAG: hypothetical protein ACK40D_06790 [Cyanobacteriota bacterium]|jgi:hypothetical protein